MGVLDQIVAHKREELAGRRRQAPLAEVRRRAADAPPARPFHAALISSWPALVSGLPAAESAGGPPSGGPPALRAPAGTAGVRLIAEVKGSSPSAGTIRAEFDPVAIARTYAAAGASAVSVLTDARFFAGADDHLTRVRAAVDIPVLRKDFTLDPYQVYEARAIGADAVLLIAAILDRGAVADLASLAGDLGMAALVEAHTEPEVATALAVRAALVGINNRNLDTLETSLDVTRHLRPLVPPEVTVVAESGIEERRDVEEMERLGVHAVLVGTALMRAADPGALIRHLLGIPAQPRVTPASRGGAAPDERPRRSAG